MLQAQNQGNKCVCIEENSIMMVKKTFSNVVMHMKVA